MTSTQSLLVLSSGSNFTYVEKSIVITTKKETLAALVKALPLAGLIALSACASIQPDVEEDPLVFKDDDPGIPQGPGIIEKLTGKKLEVGI